jgi:hypothetical protein
MANNYSMEDVVQPTPAVPSMGSQALREPKYVETYGTLDSRLAAAKAKLASTEAGKETNSQTTINENGSSSEAPKSTPAETVTLSPQMAALARKEQKFRQQEQALKDREAALAARAEKLAKLEALEAKLASKDYSGLEELGISYEEYTSYLLNKQQTQSPEQQAVKKLAEELESVKKAQADDVAKRFDAAVEERRKAVTALVESNPEYSSIKELKMEEAVIQHILDTWEHDGVDLSPEQAAKEVEEILVEKATQLTSLTKLKPKEAAKELPPLKQGVKTLTNNMQAIGEIKRPQKPLHGMTDSERYAEARKRAEEKLKQGIKI